MIHPVILYHCSNRKFTPFSVIYLYVHGSHMQLCCQCVCSLCYHCTCRMILVGRLVAGVGVGYATHYTLYLSLITISLLSPSHSLLIPSSLSLPSVLSMVVPVYNAEVAPKHLRGRLVSLTQLLITAGIMVCALASYTPYV